MPAQVRNASTSGWVTLASPTWASASEVASATTASAETSTSRSQPLARTLLPPCSIASSSNSTAFCSQWKAVDEYLSRGSYHATVQVPPSLPVNVWLFSVSDSRTGAACSEPTALRLWISRPSSKKLKEVYILHLGLPVGMSQLFLFHWTRLSLVHYELRWCSVRGTYFFSL